MGLYAIQMHSFPQNNYSPSSLTTALVCSFLPGMLQFTANRHDFVILTVYTLLFQHILRINNLKLKAPDRDTSHGLVAGFKVCHGPKRSQVPSHWYCFMKKKNPNWLCNYLLKGHYFIRTQNIICKSTNICLVFVIFLQHTTQNNTSKMC